MVCASFIETIQVWDQDATLFLNGLHCSASDQFWMFMSNKLAWAPLYLICAYFLFRRLGWKKALIVLASVGLAFLLCDQISNLFKNSVGRLRPSYNYRMISGGLNLLEGRGGLFGFFSAHAANAFAVALCMNIGLRNDPEHTYNAFCKWSIVWATMVAVSRIFVGKHFLGDVLVGTMVGILIGYFVAMATRYIIQKHIDKIPTTGFSGHFNK